MTKPLRMAGVVVVAVAAIAVPSLALGNSSQPSKHPRPVATVLCPLAGGTAAVLKGDAKVKSHRHHSRHHRHRKPLTGTTGPTIGCLPPPCLYNARPWTGASGATGPTVHCPPFPCPGATGSTGTTAAAGATVFCRPIPCFYRVAGASGVSGPTSDAICRPLPCAPPIAGSTGPLGRVVMICRPLPCPLASAVRRGKAKAAIFACPPIPICPLASRGTNVPGRAASMCPCPPEPMAGPARTTLHACPETGAGTAAAGSDRAS
jgi:hypothetical protein